MLAASSARGRAGAAGGMMRRAAAAAPWRRRGGAPLASAALALAASAEQPAAASPAPPAPLPPAPERYSPGTVLEITGPDDYSAVRASFPDRLVVLMAKARSCRPCKAFSRKYSALASRFPEALLLEIYGDDSPASRQMMIAMQVRVTPTFRLSRGEREVGALTGTSDAKLRDALVAALTEGERSAHPDDVAAWRAAQEAAREAAALEAATAEKAVLAAASAGSSAASSVDEQQA